MAVRIWDVRLPTPAWSVAYLADQRKGGVLLKGVLEGGFLFSEDEVVRKA